MRTLGALVDWRTPSTPRDARTNTILRVDQGRMLVSTSRVQMAVRFSCQSCRTSLIASARARTSQSNRRLSVTAARSWEPCCSLSRWSRSRPRLRRQRLDCAVPFLRRMCFASSRRGWRCTPGSSSAAVRMMSRPVSCGTSGSMVERVVSGPTPREPAGSARLRR